MPARKALPEQSANTLSYETDESLADAANRIFGDMLEQNELDVREGPPTPEDEKWLAEHSLPFPETGQRPPRHPGTDKMVTVRGGGLYLPVRQRVGWMRQEPVAHPDWTIETIEVKVVEGKLVGPNKVEGGYARYKTNIYDETGRLIATGTKTEYSERFLDFVEKAETGSIGRAMAVAGYGTEAAMDLDEGYRDERLADAPVSRPPDPAGRPISITPSAIPGVSVGGRSPVITEPQMKEVARLSRTLHLGWGLIPIMEQIKGEEMPVVTDDAEAQNTMLDFLRSFTNEQAGQLIQTLTKALNEAQAGEGNGAS